MMASEEKKTVGVIYVLWNPSFPEFVKIGYADDINARLKQLNRSECIPYAFQVYGTYEVEDRLTDIALQKMLDKNNEKLRVIEIDPNTGKTRRREFFRMSKEDAFGTLEYIAQISGTTSRLHYENEFKKVEFAPVDDENKVNNKKVNNVNKTKRKSPSAPFSFTECDIEPGSIITFYKDENIKARVIGETNVEFEGVSYSITGLTKKILNLDEGKSIQGPAKWKYEGELLTKRRARLEKDGLYK